ncbi:unnamed protein product [Urochloa decumbens]|uniref:Protein kinase domain-containing protein n=1 Tax=Urochloa decumbens TaxID=240449 RepID=A0ABC9AM37_9POAL
MDGKASTAYDVLERMLLDESQEPTKLPLSLLEAITDGFSDEREIGRGGFAVVYKGIVGVGMVAVKKLSERVDMDEEKFSKEVQCLMKVRHNNIVRFLGYCGDTQSEIADYDGRFVMADQRNRLLCFEFVPNGSLRDYIADASCGLRWSTRYRMIRGICEGLHYLHEKNIVHLDLKPANILLDHNMVPKIADFGLSRCFDENQSRDITSKLIGSVGYLPQEFYSGQITFKLDIYSLGVIIFEILTGYKGYSTEEEVLESWRNRLEIPWEENQVKACTKIGKMCIDTIPANRPTTQHIINTLGVTEFAEAGGSSSVEQIRGGSDACKYLRVHPLQLRFPLESDKVMISCPLHLTNITDDHVAFRVVTKSPKKNFKGSLCGIVPPRSRYTLAVTMCSQLKLPSGSKEFFTLESSIDVYHDQQKGTIRYAPIDDNTRLVRSFASADEKGHDVHKVKLTAAYNNCHDDIQPRYMITPLEPDTTVDVHPTEPWILTGHSNGFVHIRNYHTLEILNTFEVGNKGSPVLQAKFIERKEWFVAQDRDGYMYVYGFDKKLVMKRYRSGWLLTIHPTEPYMLLYKHFMELLDWEKDWKCIWQSNGHDDVYLAKFNPEDTGSFASVVSRGVKIWDIDSGRPHGPMLLRGWKGHCLDYLTLDDELYLVTSGLHDGTAKIWDYQTGSCVQTLEGHTKQVTSVCSHPDLPILITGSEDGTVRLWDLTTFKGMRQSLAREKASIRPPGGVPSSLSKIPRVQCVIDCGLGGVKDIYSLKGSRRIMIVHEGALVITEIEN